MPGCRIAVCALMLLSCPVFAAPASVAGQWKFTVELEVGTSHPTVTLKQQGDRVTGTYDGRYGASPLEGRVKDDAVELTVSMTAEGIAVSGLFKGLVEGERMSGTVEFDQVGEGTWSAVRVPPGP